MKKFELSKEDVSTAAWACIEFLRKESKNMQKRDEKGVSTAAWACIEFLPATRRSSSSKFASVSTAAWACIEFLQPQSFYIDLNANNPSQQPLGLALSFYISPTLNSSKSSLTSQQPLGLALSFYSGLRGETGGAPVRCLNSRLGLH